MLRLDPDDCKAFFFNFPEFEVPFRSEPILPFCLAIAHENGQERDFFKVFESVTMLSRTLLRLGNHL